MGQDTELIEVKDDAPGAAPAPGISVGDLLKWAPVIQKLISILTTGEGGFDVKFQGIRKHVEISNIP